MKAANKLGKLALFLIPIGVGINFVGYQIFYVLLKTPFACDAIGTVLVGALCGPFAGGVTGLVTNLINSITNPTSMFFAILSIGFGVSAGLLARKGMFNNIWKVALSSIVFAVIGGIGSALICWPLYGFDFFGSTSQILIAIPLYEATHISKFLCATIASFVMDIPDKLIVSIAAFCILKALPIRYLVKLPNGKMFIKKGNK